MSITRVDRDGIEFELTPDELTRLVVAGLISTKQLARRQMHAALHCVYDKDTKDLKQAKLTIKYPGLRVVKNEND